MKFLAKNLPVPCMHSPPPASSVGQSLDSAANTVVPRNKTLVSSTTMSANGAHG